MFDHILEIVEASNKFIRIYASNGQQIHSTLNNKPHVYFLTEGRVDIYRKTDDILIFTVYAPHILGLFFMFEKNDYHYFRASTDATFTAIPTIELNCLADSNNLWKHFFLMTCEIASNFFKRDQRFSSKNAYDIIKNNLEAIWELPENERSQISVFKFILSRSTISRSSLNKVLKDLNDGGYIKIHRGKLLNIKNLPLKY
ncbi:helix-turn-helix domain-containing protein [Enterobacter cloacae complex sp. P1B]|uniref:helix-turn-helix domain-containing protein n=1 Tax=Enterobacter cloacae complex sp. P1B TaxID=2779593 RepID=UPI001874CEA1|nr:helix-turn-helix domain-containing protein [Enterobacter cloacae complex sp. P1B]MBE4947037.1 helix-turn-helix domain-containing protein [Enterobacter cloacae complex sp. P1B]